MNYKEKIISFLGENTIVLKEGNHEEMIESLRNLHRFDYPLMEDLDLFLETRFGELEEKHKRFDDMTAHKLYAKVLHDIIILVKPDKVVELGILAALSSSAFFRARLFNQKGHLTSFDPNISNIFWTWFAPDSVKNWSYYGMTGEYGYTVHGQEVGEIDLLYIDAAHTYDNTAMFLRDNWIHNVKPGGFIVLDDCCPQFQEEVPREIIPSGLWKEASGYGILKAVLEFVDLNVEKLDYAFIINADYSTGICIIKLKEGCKI